MSTIIPRLFALGFGATAFTLQPVPSVVALIVLYQIIDGGPTVYALSAFLGALTATIFGNPAGWTVPEIEARSSAAILLIYVGQIAVRHTGIMLGEAFLLLPMVIEHAYLDPTAFRLKWGCSIILYVLCALFVVNGEAQIFCCFAMMICALAVVHGGTIIKRIYHCSSSSSRCVSAQALHSPSST